ncbi:MAG: outer membrane beta-barrel protein [Acidobacteriota bacterium]|nr:outer membrane beta-barrel protein [Acidobacteriota bacterium]
MCRLKGGLLFYQRVLISGLVLILSAAAEAETWKARELRLTAEKAAWQFGPLKLQPAILIKDAGYDSNVYYQPEATSDFWLTAGPAMDAYLVARRRVIVHVFESPQYVFFFKTDRERTWNNYLHGDISLSLNRFLLTVGGRLNNARERWNTELDIRPRRKERGGSVSLLYQMSYRLSFEFSARKVDYTYESLEYGSVNINERLTHLEEYLSSRIYYRLNPRIQFFLEGQKGSYDFKDPLNPGDSRSRTIYSGFQFSPTGRIHGQIRIGYQWFDTLDTDLPDYQGLVGDTSVSWQMMRPLVLRGSYRRDINFSVWSSSPYYVSTTWSAGPSFYIFRRKFRLDYTFSQTRNKYPLGETAGSPPRRDDYTLNSIAVYYRITKTAGIGLTAGTWERKIDVLGWDANRKFIGLNLTYDF